MTRKLRIYAEAPEPVDNGDGITWCTDKCKHYRARPYVRPLCAIDGDGRLSELSSAPVCAPAIREMAAELSDLRVDADVTQSILRRRLEEACAERDALRADKEYLRGLLYKAGELVRMDSFNAPEVVAEEIEAAIVNLRAEVERLVLHNTELESRERHLEAEVARKVEPLSDAERNDLWDAILAYTREINDPSKWCEGNVGTIARWMDRLQGRGGET